jgi:flagellar hook-associated protein 3 FlgL
MIGRITSQMETAQVLADINSSQDALNVTQEQLSTGLTINQPSDNPYGASLAVQLNQSLSSLNAYNGQITDGSAWTQATGTALTTIQSALERAQELVVGAANGSESSTDRSATAVEIGQLTQQILQAANSQYNGQYIFGGSQTGTQPYSTTTQAYQGDNGSVTREIGPNTSIQVNTDISPLLGSGTTGSGLLATLNSISTDLSGGSASQIADLSNQITNLQSNLNTLEQMQAGVGTTQDRLTSATNTIQSLQTAQTQSLSNDEDANMATTMTTYTSQQAAFEAALQAGAKIVQTSLMDFLSTSGS